MALNSKNLPRTTHLTRLLLLGLVSVSLSAVAQSEAQTSLERVEVVGSNIKRVDKEGPLPVVIITREEIAKTGASNLMDLVKVMGISGGQQIDTGASGSFVTGAAGAGFRGLPATDTLVLLNGRRIAPYGRSQQSSSGGAVSFVDLNSLPLSAVEQVQILKDGASAIYGADAVAGVMNIITRKDYVGAEANVSFGRYSETGGQESKINATIGFGAGEESNFSGMIMAEAAKTQEIWNKDRSFTKSYDYRGVKPYLGDYRSSYSPYGNWDADGSGLTAGANCPSQNLRSGLCRYDFGDVEQVQPSIDRTSGMFVGNLKINSDVKAFTELGYNRNVTTSASRAPALATATDFTQVDAFRGLALGTTQGLVSAALASQYNALGTDPLGLGAGLSTLDARTRFTEFGPRTDIITTDSTRYLFGLKGTTKNELDWELAYLSSEQRVTDVAGNEINKLLLADLLVSGAVTNLFTDSAHKGGYNSARYVGNESTLSKLAVWDFKVSGELTKLPAGSLGFAVGAETRNENMSSSVDPVTRAGLKSGSASVEVNGERNVNALYAELSIPLTKELESQLAMRTEQYSDFGRSTNPKIAIRYQPTKEFLMRASASTAFKAPTLFQLYEGQSAGGYEELSDTLRCDAQGGVDVGPSADCDASLREVRSGGVIAQGLTLKPEKSNNYNIGFVFSPSADFNVGLDFWKISKTDAIIKADAQTLIDTNSPAVLRNASVGGLPGTIVRVTSTYFNASSQELEGVDLDVNAKTKLENGARLGAGLSLTYNSKFEQTDNNETINLLGQYYYFIVPQYRLQVRSSYDVGDWATAVYYNYIPGYKNEVAKGAGATAAQESADDYATVDVFASYSGFKNVVLSGGIRNLMDALPVYLAGSGPATDPSMYDMRGRYFYFNANFKF